MEISSQLSRDPRWAVPGSDRLATGKRALDKSASAADRHLAWPYLFK